MCCATGSLIVAGLVPKNPSDPQQVRRDVRGRHFLGPAAAAATRSYQQLDTAGDPSPRIFDVTTPARVTIAEASGMILAKDNGGVAKSNCERLPT